MRIAAIILVASVGCTTPTVVPRDTSIVDASASDAPSAEGGPLDARSMIDAADARPALVPWLLTVGNSPDGSHPLAQVSVGPGELGRVSRIICPNLVFGGPDVPNDVVSALTFHEGILYASGASAGGAASQPASALYRIDICACSATRIGNAFGPDLTGVGSITSYNGRAIYGMAPVNDAMIEIDPATGVGTVVRELSIAVGASGITWSGPTRDTLWFVTGDSDTLFELDARGDVLSMLDLAYDFGGLGMEYHPAEDRLFACTFGRIVEIDATTGDVAEGPMIGAETGWTGGCANLAAPFGSVECVD